jgi:ATP-dependent DNA helicase
MTRFLITGTPLQNNLRELWSLLHFLMPSIFTEWELFEAWFDFSDEMKDEDRTKEFIQDKMNQDLLKKMHFVLQPMLLRRVKADVEHLLPRKREYVLYAPLTNEQTELYNVINDKTIDTRQYLEDKVIERLSKASKPPTKSRKAKPTPPSKDEVLGSDTPLSKLAIRQNVRGRPAKAGAPKNAFQSMMENRSSSAPTPARGQKRKSLDSISSSPAPKSAKSSRASTPRSATPATSTRGRKLRQKVILNEGNSEEEDALSDNEFEAKLADEVAALSEKPVMEENEEEAERSRILALASKFSLPISTQAS